MAKKQDLLRVLKLLVGAMQLHHQGARICLNLSPQLVLTSDSSRKVNTTEELEALIT